MSGWGDGYVTDIAYAPGYYTEQSPRMMAATARIAGFEAHVPGRHETYHFVDIGSGRGHTALILAAANPGWLVTGLDFNPAHIASAQALAARAGLANCRFIEADLARFAETGEARILPDFDAVSFHGVWTWVAPEVREGIVRLLGTKLKPGGLCHASYNVLPAWRSMLGLQRLIREGGSHLASRSDRQAQRGLDLARRLAEAEGSGIDFHARAMLDHIADKPVAYLAHEFMNIHWSPCFHLDVAAQLSQAKLSFAGSGRLLENFPDLILDAGPRQIAEEFDDPAMLELIKDVCLDRPLRHDVFLRGATRTNSSRRDECLAELMLGLATPLAKRSFEFATPAGKASMNEAVYGPIFERLAEGPATVGELTKIARRQVERDNLAELAAILLGTGQALLVAEPAARMDPPSVRLNAALFAGRSGAEMTRPAILAVPALGGGITLPGFAAFAVLRQHDWLSEATIGQPLPRPGPATFHAWSLEVAPEEPPENQEKIADALGRFLDEHGSVLNALGLPC